MSQVTTEFQKLQDQVKKLKEDNRKVRKEYEALKANFDQLADDARQALHHLNDRCGGAAWETLDVSLKSVGEKSVEAI